MDTSDRVPDLAPVVPRGSSPPLNREKLLAYFEDEPSAIEKLLDLFIKEAQADMADLTAACGTMDSARIASVAHRLKGAASSIGAEPLRVEAARLEALGRSGELTEAGACIARLQVESEAFSKYVAELMQRDLPRNGGSP